MATTQTPLISTVTAGTPDSVDTLATSSTAAAADSMILQSEIQSSLSNLLSKLASNAVISEKDPIRQFSEANPAIASFVAKLQESIFNAKSSTTQGLLLKTQLDNGSITQEKFASDVNSISLTAAQAQSAVAANVSSEIQKLLLSITNDSDLKKLDRLASSVSSRPDSPAAKLDSNSINKDSITEDKLKSNYTDSALPQAEKLSTTFKDKNLDFFQQIVEAAKAIARQNALASAASLIGLKPQPRIMSGARAVIKINGQVAALCTNVSYEITMDWSEIRGIDELIPNDLAPNSFSVKGSMILYRVPNKSPIKDYLSQDMFSGILWPYSTIEIRDKRTDELIMLVRRAAITSRAESFAPGQLTATTMSFVGVGFRDEEVPQLLPDKLPNDTGSSMWDKFANGLKKLNPFG